MRTKNLFLLSLLTVALLPYFVICFYAMPFADDFCFGWTASENTSFFQKFLNQYLLWNGRYTADILVNLHPLVTGSLLFYQLSLFASLIATIAVVFIFVKQFLADWVIRGIVSLAVVLFYLCYQPNLTEGTYWYIGVVNYNLGNLCLLLQFVVLATAGIAQDVKRILLITTSAILLIIAIGFNEIGALLIPLFYFSAFILNLRLKLANQKLLLFFFLIALISSVFVFLSPGNFTRQSEFANRYNFWHSLFYSSLQTIRFIGKWMLSIPFMGLNLLVIRYADRIENKLLLKLDYRVILFALLFTVFVGSFLPYFATGILGQHRTINYMFFYFIFLWIACLISLSGQFGLSQKLEALTDNRSFVLLCVCIITMAVTGNGFKIITDFGSGSFTSYNNEFTKRNEQLLLNPYESISPLKTIPKTFTIVDAKADSSWWVNKCMLHYYESQHEE